MKAINKVKNQRMSTSSRMILSTLIIVTVLFIAMIYTVAGFLFSTSIERSKKADTENANRLTSALNESFNGISRLLSLAHQSFEEFDFQDGMAHESVGKILTTLMELNPSAHSAWFIAEPGVHHEDRHCITEYLWREGAIVMNETDKIYGYLETPEKASWYYIPLTTGKTHYEMLGRPDYGEGPVYIATISVPISGKSGIIGVCGINVLYKDMLDLPLLQEEQNRLVMLVSQDMTILQARDGELIGQNLSDFPYESLADMRRSVERGELYAKETVEPLINERAFLYLQPISFGVDPTQNPLYLYVATPLSALYADAYEIVSVLVIASSLCMLCILVIIFANVRKIILPVRLLTLQAQQTADGDFELERFGPADDKTDGKNEVAVLRQAFVKLLGALQKNLHTVETRVLERTKELTELNNYISMLMESTSNVSILLDRELKILYCSKNFLSMLRADNLSKVVGKPLDAILAGFQDAGSVERVKNRVQRVLSGEEQLVEDDAVIWPDGSSRLYRIMYNQVRDENNSFTGLVIVMLDLTDVRLEEAQQRMDDMLNTTRIPCMIWDDNGEVIAVNDEFKRVFDLPSDAEYMETDKVLSFIQSEYQPDGRRTEDIRHAAIKSAIKNGFAQEYVQFRGKNGAPAYYLVNAARISWLSSYRLVIYCYDRTDLILKEAEARESRERENELIVKNEAAQAANEAKSRFVANMSHEIRTPMNAVLGMAELLMQENLNDRQYGYAKDIRTSAEALLDIINDILDVSKIQAGKLSLVPEHYDFKAMLENINSIVRFLVEDKDVLFKMDIGDGVPGCLCGDDIRLRQVLLNLLGNAVKFTSAGHVHLAVRADDQKIYFTISDTGIGIKPEDAGKLFDAFEQFDARKNREKCGTGLGLSITKVLVEMMDGKISVDSVYGQGSSFHVEIPLVPGDGALVKRGDDKQIDIYAPEARVLVVDDNAVNLNVACGLLRLSGVNAETATSGMQAVELVKKTRYDIVFMDHMMPEMDGLETTVAIRELGVRTPIIALTASAVPGTKELMLAAGMDDYLPKPVVSLKLKQMLKKWLPAEKQSLRPDAGGLAEGADDDIHINTEFWDKIGRIGELSVATGLVRVEGQRDVYETTLKMMIKEIGKCLLNLNDFLEVGDMQGFRTEVHGIKGSLANVGAMALSEKAGELESASGRGDTGFCKTNLPAMQNGLIRLREQLDDAFASIVNMSCIFNIPMELLPIFDTMLDAFNEMDVVAVDECVERLGALSLDGALGDEIGQLSDAAMMTDFDGAAGIIEKLKGICA